MWHTIKKVKSTPETSQNKNHIIILKESWRGSGKMFWAGVIVGAVITIVALFTYCTLVVGKKSEQDVYKRQSP